MFDPDEYVTLIFICYQVLILVLSDRETEPDWDKDLAEEVKGECQSKYGKVLHIKVERDSEVCVSNLHHLAVLNSH